MPYGLQAMLKDGHKHMSGMEDAVFRNIDACKQLSVITKTSMGPNGRCSHGDLCSCAHKVLRGLVRPQA